MSQLQNVLFVCTGNICRSPMAEFLFRSRLGTNLQWTCGSAGLTAANGVAPSQTAIEVMNEIGIDIRTHCSRELTPELIHAATIILVMTDDQALEVKKRFPEARDRVHLLSSFKPHAQKKDIQDPVGTGIEFYRWTLNDISGSMDGLIRYLRACSGETL